MGATKETSNAEIQPPEYKSAGANWHQQKQIKRLEEQGYTAEETSKILSIDPATVEAFRTVSTEEVKPRKKYARKPKSESEPDDNDW